MHTHSKERRNIIPSGGTNACSLNVLYPSSVQYCIHYHIIHIRVCGGGYTHTVACTRTTDIMLNDVWQAPALHYVSKGMGRRKTSRSLFIIIIIIILLAAPRQRLNADYGLDRYTRRRRRLGWDAGKNKEWEKKILDNCQQRPTKVCDVQK